ncbi:Sodium/calcium exchanger protein-domain-containing protein [Mycotypha africana]|uniref:Sodium/calcium exchanger protein-domain-containing protein n=1 Tax=Mycotypha africana TaxID=64632 RepID=UPI00230152F6|nr:Sodium/calcium exchanger protein-domain-containing protein [Mycotypha africana]KAI8992158.1 Sodium/calcium exchanger protein-domain-containing protein [Mycotypha africana]
MNAQTSPFYRTFYILAFFALVFSFKISISQTRLTLPSALSNTASFSPTTTTLNDNSSYTVHCRDIELHEDQCEFVRSACHGFNAIYLELYYCSGLWKPLSTSILLTALLMLFGAIGVVAADFFCPNLQTISAKLHLSESMAGVTILALGNGSPDLFSTFSALDTGAGSLAIGELIGAAFFIVAVVSGSMGIIKPFQSERITFMRDTSFLTGAIILIFWIIYHQRIYWYHSVALIGYYLVYVSAVVLSGSSSSASTLVISEGNSQLKVEGSAAEVKKGDVTIIVDETSHLLSSTGTGKKPPRLTIPSRGYSPTIQSNMSDFSTSHLGHIIRPTSPLSTRNSIYYDALMPKSMSSLKTVSSIRTHRRPMTPRIGIRSSVFGAIEFQQQVYSLIREKSKEQLTSPTWSQYLNINKQYNRQRQVSMPQSMHQQQQHQHVESQVIAYPSNYSAKSMGRQRSSTTAAAAADHRPLSSLSPSSMTVLSSTPQTHHINLPHSPSLAAGDYFTYLSLHNSQPHFIQSHQKQEEETTTILSQPPIIPTINILEIQPSSASIYSNSYNHYMEDGFNDLRKQQQQQHNTSLLNYHFDRQQTGKGLTPASPHTSEYEHFVSARESPVISPSTSVLALQQYEQQPQPRQQRQTGGEDEYCLSLKVPPLQQQQQTSASYSLTKNSMFIKYLTSSSTSKIIYLFLQDIIQLLFPTLEGWKEKDFFSKLNALASTPFILIFTLTLPVAESENIKMDDIEVVARNCDILEEAVVQQQQFEEGGKYHSRASSNNNNTVHRNNRSYLSVNYATTVKSLPIVTPHQKVAETESTKGVATYMEEDNVDIQQGWNKHILIVQCIFSLLFIFGVFYMNGMIPSYFVSLGGVVGLLLAGIVCKFTKKEEPPSWFWMISFFGFFVSLNWIFLLANEVVGLLQALGEIFCISESIMGLTVFALGNSIGDLVTNTAMAKMGFPTMAISACYAGPLLNMVLGVGVSSFYQTWKLGEAYKLDIAPTILISAGGLMTVLISTLIVVNINGYHVTQQLGWWMIFVYFACCFTNFLIEFEVLPPF